MSASCGSSSSRRSLRRSSGSLFEDVITTHLGEPWQIAIFLAVFAVVLPWIDKSPL